MQREYWLPGQTCRCHLGAMHNLIFGWKLTDLQLRFHDTSCSRPCICRDEDRTSPSSRLARRRTWWSLPQRAAHGMLSPQRWPEHRRSTWSGCADKAPNWFEIWQLSLVKKNKIITTVRLIPTNWHSICHTFWHSIWHIFWDSIWHMFWYSIWHVWQSFQYFFYCIYCDTLRDILSGILYANVYILINIDIYAYIYIYYLGPR